MSTRVQGNRARSGGADTLRSPHPDALELIADLLLESAGRDDEYPAYSEDYLVRRDHRRHADRAPGWSRYTCTDVLLLAEIEDLSTSALLSADEDIAWRMSLDGSLPEEIAEELSTTRTRAVRLVNSARSRVASCSSRVRGLYSAYQSLVHRYRYHGPTHPG